MLERAKSTPEGATITDLLSADHRRLDDLLADAKQALRAGEPARAVEPFTAFREGLERHIVVEEEQLFPVFEELTGIVNGPTGVMRSEHAELRRLLAEIADGIARAAQDAAAASTGAGDPSHGLAQPLASLTALLFAHNGKEERILYPATDRAAEAAGRLEALVAQIEL
ncbi:MAG TPA: hemerythrin domain-containing protein [Myxococcota bacterium]